MRTVDYSEILYGSAALAGLQPADLDANAFALFRTFHDRRLQVAWEIHRWPDLCPIEQRYYRQLWNSGTTYAAGDERFDLATGKYFQSLQAANLNNAPSIAGVENSVWWAECKNGYSGSDWATGTVYTVTNGSATQVRDPLTGLYYQIFTAHTAGATIDLTKMGLLTAFNKYIAYTQTGSTAIGEYFTATDRDPRITTQKVTFPFWLSQSGAQFTQPAPNTLWLYFRILRPTLLGSVFDATLSYAIGAQVYFAATSGGSGNFYTASASTTPGQSPLTSPSNWVIVPLPYFLRGYLIEAGYSDWLVADGQDDKAMAHEGFAQTFLELEADKLQRQQQQVRRINVT